MPVTNKAEAEALSVEELKTELESRGLPTEGLKQAIMLETLLKHLDAAALTTNGDSKKEVDEPNGNCKGDAAPENGESTKGEESNKDAAPDAATSKTEEPKKDDTASPVEPASAEAAADKPAEENVAPAAEGSAPTRPADEVSGGTEQPDAKKPKADADPETVEPAKAVETPAEAPAAESAA